MTASFPRRPIQPEDSNDRFALNRPVTGSNANALERLGHWVLLRSTNESDISDYLPVSQSFATPDGAYLESATIMRTLPSFDVDRSWEQHGSEWLPLNALYAAIPNQAVSRSRSDDPKILTEGTIASQLVDNLMTFEDLVILFIGIAQEARDEFFTDGEPSMFASWLESSIGAYTDTAIAAWEHVLNLGSTNAEVADEMLRQIGNISDTNTHHARLAILLRNLESMHPRFRDAASLGIAAMDDPIALESVRNALNHEQLGQLKENLSLVLAQLQATEWLNT